MVINRPSIFIYAYEYRPDMLRELCAGMEEEGVFFELFEMGQESARSLAHRAAEDSMLGTGIGICGSSVVLQMRGLKEDHPVAEYDQPDAARCRILGENAARSIKKMPFRTV